jgi:hypothetical protein
MRKAIACLGAAVGLAVLSGCVPPPQPPPVVAVMPPPTFIAAGPVALVPEPPPPARVVHHHMAATRSCTTGRTAMCRTGTCLHQGRLIAVAPTARAMSSM